MFLSYKRISWRSCESSVAGFIQKHKLFLSWLQMIHETPARWEKHARCARDNVKINSTRFAIWLFSNTIKFYPLLREKIPLFRAYLPLLPRDSLRSETREICLMKQQKKYEITRTHMSRFAYVFRISWMSRESSVADFTQNVTVLSQLNQLS